MPLPDRNMPWPPRHLDDAFKQYSNCQIWWEGDADKLSTVGGENARPALSGGFLSRIRRLFWGTSRESSQQPRQLHVPVAADIVQTAASMLLPEPVRFRPAVDDETANEDTKKRLDKIGNSPQMHSAMLAAIEACSALGDVYARVVWNSDVCDHVWLDFVDADQCIPEFRYGRLSALTVWTVVDENPDEGIVYRHLERHEPGGLDVDGEGFSTLRWSRIYHGLYKGSAVSLGTPLDLSAHPETASIPVVPGTDYVEVGTTRMTAWHIPNAGRNPAFRRKPVLQHLGRSDIGDPAVIGLMDAIDETYSSLARDIRLAKARLLVSDFLLEMKAPGKGSTFSIDQEVFEKVGGVPTGQPVLEAHQFEIRVDPHVRTAEAYLRAILRRIGFSPYTFGLADEAGGAMTATEVDAKRDASTATFQARSGIWKGVLAEAMRTLIEVDDWVFKTGARLSQDVEVRWPPAARESTQQKAITLASLKASASASTEWRVAYLNQDWDDKEIGQEVARIKAEESVADPFALPPDSPVDPVTPADEEPDDEPGDEPSDEDDLDNEDDVLDDEDDELEDEAA